MKSNRLLYSIGILAFVGLLFYALLQELDRNQIQLRSSISGVIKATPLLGSFIVKTDNAYLLLFESGSSVPVAKKVLNPFVPPTTFQIGQSDALKPLKGAYRLLVITDKDGNPDRPSAGEGMGMLTGPLPLGLEGVEYLIDRAYRGLPAELMEDHKTDTTLNIRGTVDVAPELSDRIEAADRMVIMLFDPSLNRPVAFSILPHFELPQHFSIGVADAMSGAKLDGRFFLRILTDKNNQPFEASPGELIFRSPDPVPLGTKGLSALLDREYVR